ncbi:reverse transcriptase-like protein [uncultured Fluviicola sp.]|uniref:reverse transcriptase-like protein n=1 Tax=uncultured Fluviicola sp. TaxID=463303 RepID=UPI00345CC82A
MCKLNFDGSKLNNGNASLGFVIRNSGGDVLLAGAKALGPNISIIQAEAWAMKERIRGALSRSISISSYH